MKRHPANAAFTLIEMLIVMTIGAILITSVLGLVQNQAATAKRAANADTVRQTRQAIALFREQTGQLPNLMAGWEPLTTRTKVGVKFVGPFMNRAPRNAFVARGGNPSCIADGNVAVLYLEDCSFLYDYNGGNGTGRFIAANEYTKPLGAPVEAAAVATAEE